MFTKSFVINLAFKQDRLETFLRNVPACLGPIDVWPAVHGDTVLHPDWWTAGRGAWGCYRSHLQILEHCYNAGIESYLVFEDDALFRTDFESLLSQVLLELPADWEQLYLGGQLLHEQQHPPQRITDNLFIPYNVNRTHGFAVHRRGYEKLYRHLNSVPFQEGEHIDHHLGRLHESQGLKTYCPGKWLVGQDGGPSNISGNTNAVTFWIDPEKSADKVNQREAREIPAVFLESNLDVAIELERRGWHRGHWQNENRLDRGVCQAIASPQINDELHRWYKAVIPEAVREGKACVCLYHPSLTWSRVQTLDFARFTHIQPATIEEAEKQLLDVASRCSSSHPVKSNLIYHIWPRRGNGVWQWNVSQLLQRIEQFTGTRSIGVATSDDADALEVVQSAFDGTRIDNWIVVPNDPHLGEVATFGKLLETLPKEDHSVTFYGHAKGVRYDDPMQTKAWTAMLYEVCLDDPDYVRASLDQFPTTGPFIRTTPWEGGAKHHWFFSGSFFWFRNADAFSKPDWSMIRQDYWGSELWPSSLFTRTESGELFGQECGHLYEPHELERMRAWLADWRSKRRGEKAANPK
jgi:GR25 family glycosyltransferase involved in LPS biosynthesis